MVDPDVDPPVLPSPRWIRVGRFGPVAVLLGIAFGGAVGASARHGAAVLWPTSPGGFPWTTLVVNAAGCVAIGVLMVAVEVGRPGHPLVRPLLGTGVLGGFTTFSAYAVEAEGLLADGRIGWALGYVLGTVLTALVGVWLGVTVTRWWTAPGRRGAAMHGEAIR